MILKTSTIELRAPEPRDVDFLYQLENDRRLWHLTQTLVPFSHFELEQYVFSLEKHEPFAAKQVRFMIDLQINGNTEVIGTIDLFDLDALNRRAGVGIVIVEANRGKGYAGMALSLLENYALDDLNLHQLFCNVEQDNVHSLTLFEKQGFQKVGLKRDWNLRSGKWVDVVLLQKINKLA